MFPIETQAIHSYENIFTSTLIICNTAVDSAAFLFHIKEVHVSILGQEED
jgi:hypothetical protein